MALILVMDDDASVRIALRTLLLKEGHEVLEATNGVEGANLYVQNRPDLVITDIFMPDKDGVETLLELRHDFPDVKVIVISGNAQKFLPLTEDLGAHWTLTKPFKATEILEAVRDLLERSET
ncbi:MAG: response regulator [bacterium]|nr:response regulator [bacterium]